jgi:hypothetical protein
MRQQLPSFGPGSVRIKMTCRGAERAGVDATAQDLGQSRGSVLSERDRGGPLD